MVCKTCNWDLIADDDLYFLAIPCLEVCKIYTYKDMQIYSLAAKKYQ